MKPLAKSVKKQAAKLAKDVVKKGTAEIAEIPKQASRELVGAKTDRPSPIIEVMTHSDGRTSDVSAEEEKKIKTSGLEQVKKLEDEMAKLREEKAKGTTEVQPQTVPTKGRLSEPGKPILPPSPTSPKTAARHPAEKRKRKIESRLGKN